MIAREGLYFILIGMAATAALIAAAARYDSKLAFGASLALGLLTLFTVFFFRDPERRFAPQDNILVSPADGKVIGIDTVPNHPFIGGPAVKISIFLSVFDVHINRIPADGKIDFVKYNPGKFFAAFEDKASEANEQTEIGMTAVSGQRLVFKQIAGLIARRIVCRLHPGDRAVAGDRFGMIRFGSRTELFVPADTKLEISLGQHLAGGKSVIGYLSGKPAEAGLAENNRGTNVEL